jgi:hypothetical protein
MSLDDILDLGIAKIRALSPQPGNTAGGNTASWTTGETVVAVGLLSVSLGAALYLVKLLNDEGSRLAEGSMTRQAEFQARRAREGTALAQQIAQYKARSASRKAQALDE